MKNAWELFMPWWALWLCNIDNRRYWPDVAPALIARKEKLITDWELSIEIYTYNVWCNQRRIGKTLRLKEEIAT